MDASSAEPGCLEDALESELEWIDDVLARAGREISHRPIEAGMLFVKHCVQTVTEAGEKEIVDGAQPDEWLTSSWFTELMQLIGAWYRRKYGKAMATRGSRQFRSVVVLHHTPFELRIPKTLTRPGKPGETVWLVFPVDTQPEERVLDFLVKSPNLATSSRKRFRTEHTISRIARAVRQISCNLRTAVVKYPELNELIRGIERHLERAVDDLLDDGRSGVGSALYELHMSVEKALKALLVQKHHTAKPSHDLPVLLRRVNKAYPDLQVALPSGMPTWEQVNAYRYGTPPRMRVMEAIRLYYRVLALLQPVTRALKRKYLTENAAFEIRRLPWVRNLPVGHVDGESST